MFKINYNYKCLYYKRRKVQTNDQEFLKKLEKDEHIKPIKRKLAIIIGAEINKLGSKQIKGI